MSAKRRADAATTRNQVRSSYAKIATGGGSCCGPQSSCCGASAPQKLAATLGYKKDDLAATTDANMGLSCGNPTALASLRPGEIVLDLGAGGGFDVFIAGPLVGRRGRVIGVDMTPEMLDKARKNVDAYRKRAKLDNVEFRLGEIEHLPVADNSVDAIISNCVINLSPDKPQVWREMARVLKPGGRVAVSDLALLKPLPKAVQESIEALVGCLAGAVLVEETRRMAKAAGLSAIVLAPKPGYVESMTDWNDELYRSVIKHLPRGRKISDYITSLDVSAKKSKGRSK